MTHMKKIDQSELRQLLSQHFSLDEIKAMVFDLSIDYEQLDGVSKNSKIISLIQNLSHRGRLNDLINHCQQRRPNLDFQKIVIPDPEPLNEKVSILSKPNSNQQDTDWAGYLLDYSLNERINDNAIEHICADCIEAFDLQSLLNGLSHSEKNVRKFAAKALGEIGGRFVVDEYLIVLGLIEALIAEDQDVETKRRAVWALGAIRPSHPKAREKARKILRKLLISSSEDTSVRWKAAWALGELQAREEASILAHFARNPNNDVNIRRAAVRSLGVLKATKHRAVVQDIANTKGNKLERTAEWSLAEMKSSPG